MSKKKITVKVGTPVIRSYLDGSSTKYIDIIETVTVYVETDIIDLSISLQELFEEYGNRYEKLHINGVKDCGCYNTNCSCNPSYYLCGTRLETDLEYEFRIEKERKRAEEVEARDRAKFEELKAKFND